MVIESPHLRLRRGTFSEAAVAIALVSAGRQGFIETLVNPQKTFKKVLSKLAAQTRYGAIKGAPLIKMCKHLRISQVSTAAKAAM